MDQLQPRWTTTKLVKRAQLMLMAALVIQELACAAPRRPSPKEMYSLLRASPVPLSQGGGDCSGFAEEHSTLGDLIRAYETAADGERTVHCGSESRKQHGLPCSMRMSNEVPPSRSEEEFTLFIFFEMRDRKVSAFKCFFAG